MSDDFIDFESPSGQARLIEQTQQAIDDIGVVSAASPDGVVRVWVTVSGSVVDVELSEATRQLDREELGRLITATAKAAAQNASTQVMRAFAELEQQRTRMLDRLRTLDPEMAAALGDVSASTRPRQPSGDGLFDFYRPLNEPREGDEW